MCKQNKYAFLETDSSEYDVEVVALEIGSRGLLTEENNKRLKKLYKYCQNNISYSTFKKNTISITINTSFYIFTARKDKIWSQPPALNPSFL